MSATETVPEQTEADVMAALDRARLPVQTLADAIPHLRRPFTPEAIRFKVQTVIKKGDGTPLGCLIVAYIDQRLASERLNRVIPDKWSATYEHVPGTKLMWCRLTVDGVTREDVGESTKGLSKDLVSDALKRAAVPFGVGVSCYALPEIKLWVSEARGRIEVRGKGEKQTVVITELGMEKLRAGYAAWLENHGRERFGPPLDHGDVVGATIEESVAEIGRGEGDGSEPGWQGLTPDQIVLVEGVIAGADEVGYVPLWSGARAALQMKLSGQDVDTINNRIMDWQDELERFKAQS